MPRPITEDRLEIRAFHSSHTNRGIQLPRRPTWPTRDSSHCNALGSGCGRFFLFGFLVISRAELSSTPSASWSCHTSCLWPNLHPQRGWDRNMCSGTSSYARTRLHLNAMPLLFLKLTCFLPSLLLLTNHSISSRRHQGVTPPLYSECLGHQ